MHTEAQELVDCRCFEIKNTNRPHRRPFLPTTVCVCVHLRPVPRASSDLVSRIAWAQRKFLAVAGCICRLRLA